MITMTIRTGAKGPEQVMADTVATAFTMTGMVLSMMTDYHPWLMMYRVNRACAQVFLPK